MTGKDSRVSCADFVCSRAFRVRISCFQEEMLYQRTVQAALHPSSRVRHLLLDHCVGSVEWLLCATALAEAECSPRQQGQQQGLKQGLRQDRQAEQIPQHPQ